MGSKPGEIIRTFRKSKNLTLKEFGEKIGYSYVYISDVERGKLEPSRALIKKLTTIFGLSWENLYGDLEPKPIEFVARIEVTDKDRKMITEAEGAHWEDKFVPIPIARDKISAGSPVDVREDPEGVAIIYGTWVKNRDNFTAVWVHGKSMEPTIADGSLVGIDHSQKEPKALNGRVVAIRKEGMATIKRLRIVSRSLVLGLPDNPAYMEEAVVLRGEEINNAIVGKVAWWWGKQE